MVDTITKPRMSLAETMLNSKNNLISGFSSRSSSGIDSREPYELVIEKNLRSQRKRIQDETREELTSVLERVENVKIYKLINLINYLFNFSIQRL
jgi:hypothetical protein